MNDFETPVFRSLELSRASRFSRFASAIVHVTLAVCLIAIPYAGVVTESPRRYTAVPLFVPARVAPPAAVPARIRPVVRAQRPAAKTFTPPIPSQMVRPVQPEPIEAPEIAVSRAPERKFELPALPSSAPARILSKTLIVIDTFEAGHAASLQPTQPARDLKPGGFDSAPSGGGSGGRGTSRVASAGFDNSSSTGGSHASRGIHSVAPAGFGDVQPAIAPAPVAKAAAPQVTPVEISFKPEPVYTADARRRRIEGEVQLEVNFGAAGQITVLRVVRGLDPGLDESARAAAAQLRFRPATRDGVPIDMRGVVRIVFKLS